LAQDSEYRDTKLQLYSQLLQLQKEMNDPLDLTTVMDEPL
jgi:hypothetical protein